MAVAGRFTQPSDGEAGNNLLGIAYAKAAEAANDLKDSGTSGKAPMTGEFGWKGGLIAKIRGGTVKPAKRCIFVMAVNYKGIRGSAKGAKKGQEEQKRFLQNVHLSPEGSNRQLRRHRPPLLSAALELVFQNLKTSSRGRGILGLPAAGKGNDDRGSPSAVRCPSKASKPPWRRFMDWAIGPI